MSSRSWKSFLVAVRDIDHPPRALLTKAARIAARYGGRLELLHVIALPYVVPGAVGESEATKQAEVERAAAKLERMATRLRNTGIKVSCSATWDYPAADAIVRHVIKTKPDVVFAESHHHGKLSRWFVAHTDWELIRACPCPLWLVKTGKQVDAPRVLAAIDPFHGHAKPAALDDELLRIAGIAAGSKGRVGAAHVYPLPITIVPSGLGEPVWVAASPAELKRTKRRVAQVVDKVAGRHDIKRPDRIVELGDAGSDLPVMVKRWKASLLVMGAVSRSALKRAFIGSTAERVIDGVHCDVLIVKPRAFKTYVSRKPSPTVVPIPPL